jgi:hypothetical protein
VSKFYAEANLVHLPPHRKQGTNGRPRKKGAAMPKPQEVVQQSKRRRLKVPWYGGGSRMVEIVSGVGHWFKSGHGLVPVRWVYVHDVTGTHHDEYFFTTDESLPPKTIIELYGARWNMETTFQVMRGSLGWETTRGWCRNTVLRMAPCLFLLYTLVVIFYDALTAHGERRVRITWPGKRTIAFSDMLCEVRRQLWWHWVFTHVPNCQTLLKLPRSTQDLLNYRLLQAA